MAIPTTQNDIAPGLLIAMPQLQDPNFRRAVVLMLEHNQEGSFGVVINNPVSAAVTLQSSSGAEVPITESIYLGGPVAPHVCMVIHGSGWRGERSQELAPGLCVSEPSTSMPHLLNQTEVPFRFVMGYAGWGPGQLPWEMARGAWLCSPVTAHLVLAVEPKDQWDTVIRNLGIDPMMLVPATSTQ
jgi:putative transcriptional regulator